MLERLSQEEIADILFRYGELRESRKIATIIKEGVPQTTAELVTGCRKILRLAGKEVSCADLSGTAHSGERRAGCLGVTTPGSSNTPEARWSACHHHVSLPRGPGGEASLQGTDDGTDRRGHGSGSLNPHRLRCSQKSPSLHRMMKLIGTLVLGAPSFVPSKSASDVILSSDEGDIACLWFVPLQCSG